VTYVYIYGPIDYTAGCSFWILAVRIWPPGFGPSLGQILGPPLPVQVVSLDLRSVQLQGRLLKLRGEPYLAGAAGFLRQ
jgi:hypothetical protein